MSWRPKEWSKGEGQLADVFEAGADAMLEALKEKGAWMTPEQMKLLAPDRKYPYGWLVFIPEDGVLKDSTLYLYHKFNYAAVIQFISDYIDNGGCVPEKYTSSEDYIAEQWQPLVHLLDQLAIE